MPTEPTQHTIRDVARLAGVTQRTVRYYVAQGLLPAPDGAGPGAHYGQGHLERLRLIKRLQRQHLPLAEIRSRLEGLTDGQITDLNRGDAPPKPTDSALDYIRALLGASEGQPQAGPGQAAPVPAPPASIAAPPMPRAERPALPSRLSTPVLREAVEPSAAIEPSAAAEPAAPDAAGPAPEPTLERSQWERLSLGPNLELHVRRPLSRLEQRRVERLITIARQVLREEMP